MKYERTYKGTKERKQLTKTISSQNTR